MINNTTKVFKTVREVFPKRESCTNVYEYNINVYVTNSVVYHNGICHNEIVCEYVLHGVVTSIREYLFVNINGRFYEVEEM